MSKDLIISPTDATPTIVKAEKALRSSLRTSLLVVLALLISMVLLATVVQINGAVIAVGEVSVESQVKKIGHPTGGVIAEIFVRDGDRVKPGDPLMRLDTTVSDVSADVSGIGLDQLLARQGRLQAERDGSEPRYAAELTTRNDASAQEAIALEQRSFRLQRAALAGKRAQLRERIRQIEEQITGFEAEISANSRQSALIGPELANVRELAAKQLVPLSRLNALERTAVDLDGRSAALRASIAQARAQISEVREQEINIDQDARRQASTELAEVMTRLSDQKVRQVSTADAVDRSVVRAPYAGVIDKLAYTTIGGVVPPAETIVQIVPDTDRMLVEAKISPSDRDQVRLRQAATLRFSAFDATTTPELRGTVQYVSAESAVDQRSGASYYTVRIDVDEKELDRLGPVSLAPGMPVEAFIQTGSRSFISYLIKPLADQFSRAFRHG